MFKGAVVGFIYSYVATMCLGAVAFQVYFGGEHIISAAVAAAIACYLCYKKHTEINQACEKAR